MLINLFHEFHGNSCKSRRIRSTIPKKREGTLITFLEVKKTENETNLLLFVRLGSGSTAMSVRSVFLKKRKKGMNVNLRFPKVKKTKNKRNELIFVRLFRFQ